MNDSRMIPYRYASLANLIRGGRGYAHLSQGLQNGFHNTVHSQLDGVMSNLASPGDPIFFSHHSTIDMAYQLHHQCHFGRKLSTFEKQTNVHAYEACGFTAQDGSPTAMSEIRMDVWDSTNQAFVDPHTYAVTAPYFEGLPRAYWAYVDSTDLGKGLSYRYETDEVLGAVMSRGLVCENPNYDLAQEETQTQMKNMGGVMIGQSTLLLGKESMITEGGLLLFTGVEYSDRYSFSEYSDIAKLLRTLTVKSSSSS